MKKLFKPKNRTPLELILPVIAGMKKGIPTTEGNHSIALKNSFVSGKVTNVDMFRVWEGLALIERAMSYGLNQNDKQLLAGDKDARPSMERLSRWRGVLIELLKRGKTFAAKEYKIDEKKELLPEMTRVLQAARDGVLTKQETIERKNADGSLQKVTIDVPMQPHEVWDAFANYYNAKERLEFHKLQNYLGIGLAFAGMIGTMITKDNNKSNEDSNRKGKLVGIGTTAIGALKLLQGIVEKGSEEKQDKLREMQDSIINDLLGSEQISQEATKQAFKTLEELAKQEKKGEIRVDNRKAAMNLIIELTIAIISGMYLQNEVELTKDGKIVGKSLASALLKLETTKGTFGNLIDALQGFKKCAEDDQEFREVCAKVREIRDQMEEKVYPLTGANKQFNTLEIKKFTGQFYPQKNYTTGEVKYNTTIEIPEFSIKQGEAVLLSGNSGVGKSTFLTFLKRGSIDNRNAILLDGQPVDHLGNTYITYDSDTHLGNEFDVLREITQTQSSELDEDSKNAVLEIMKELDLGYSIQQLQAMRYSQFSDGEKKRLDFLALLYRMKESPSIVIADEPFNNVQEDLIKRQMELLINCAKKYNVMLLFATHNLSLVPQELVTKRYHLNMKDNNRAVLEQKDLVKEEKPNQSEEFLEVYL